MSLDSGLLARGARFLRQGEVLGVEERVTVDDLADLKAAALSREPSEQFFVEGALHADDMEEHRELFVTEELDALNEDESLFELELGELSTPVRRMLSASSDLDAHVRLRIESNRESLPPRPLHVARFDVILEADRDNEEVELAFSEGTVPAAGSTPRPYLEGLRLEAMRLWDPARDALVLPESGPSRWAFAASSRDPGPWLILGRLGDRCPVRPLLWSVPGKGRGSLDELQRAYFRGNTQQRSAAMTAVFDRVAEDPEAPEWPLIFSSLYLLGDLPPAVLPVTVELAKHPAAAAMASIAASEDLPRIWNLLEELPFAWWQVSVRTWVRAIRVRRARILREVGRTPLARKQAAEQIRELLTTLVAQGRFLDAVSEWIRAEVLGERLDQTQFAMGLEIPFHVLEQERQSLFHRTPERRWPRGERAVRWLSEQRPRFTGRLAPLRQVASGVSGFKRPVLAAPIVAALSSTWELPVDRPTFYEMRRLRDFDPEWFDAAHMLALRIAIGILIEEDAEILR